MDTRYLRLSSGDPSVLATSPAGDFTVQLGASMPCEGHCAAFLLEATLPFTWHNVTDDDRLTVTVKTTETHVSLTPAFYTSIPTLVKALNEALKKKALGTIKFATDSTTMRVSVNCGEASIGGSFLHILGWPKGVILSGTQQAPGVGDITRGVRSAYIYIDYIKPTNAGSFQVQLLKEVPVGSHRPGDIIHWHARTPVESHQLNTQALSQIRITIKDVHNNVLNFNGFDVSLLIAIEHQQR